jgi:hypothetical protein
MPHFPCGGKDVMAVIVFQDKCPTLPLQFFLELFLFKPTRYSVQRKWQPACLDLAIRYNAYLLQPMGVTGVCWIHKCLLDAVKLVWTKPLLPIVQIWWIIWSLSLNSMLCSRLYPRISNARSKSSIKKEPMFLSCAWIHCVWQRTANKMIFGVYQVALPHY